MRTNFVLVDFENVQPQDLGLLKDDYFHVKIFLGPNQSKIQVEVAAAMQRLGPRAEYVVLEAAGKNALDFHIAYYIGCLSAEDPAAYFHIISKDTGFDPLIRHLKSRKIFAKRSICIADMPCFATAAVTATPAVVAMAAAPAPVTATPAPAATASTDDRLSIAVSDLQRRGASKPRAKKTLLSTLNALFKQVLTEAELERLFQSLCHRGYVKLDGTKITYNLPAKG